MTKGIAKLVLLTAPLALVAACDGGKDGPADGGDSGASGGGKFDDPTDAPDYCAEVACADRLADAMARDFAQRDHIRWQCGDVSGVTGPGEDGGADCSQFNDGVRAGDLDTAIACHNGTPGCAIDDVQAFNDGDFKNVSCIKQGKDDRGQEYCEYFAVIDGNAIAPDASEGNREVQVLGRSTKTESGAPYALDLAELSEDQLAWLEDEEDPDAVVGSCVFTSWHWDITEAPHGDQTYDVHGIEVNYDNFRMFGQFNNNGAANKLVFDGLTTIQDGLQGRRGKGQPAAEHPYWGSCMGMADVGAGVEWRVSDPTVGTVGAVLTECGCFAELPDGTKITDPQVLADATVPPKGNYADGTFLRGFRLGTWSGPEELPKGCRTVPYDQNAETEERDSRALVTCDITAGDIANKTNTGEMKEFCRQRYGEDVIVHVPLPSAILKCEPAEGAPSYCQGEDPWSLNDLPDTVTLAAEDLEAGAACKVSAPGDSEQRGGEQVDGEAAN